MAEEKKTESKQTPSLYGVNNASAREREKRLKAEQEKK